MSELRVRTVPSVDGDRAGFDGLVAVQREVDAERDPGDPPQPERMMISELFDTAPDRTMRVYLATMGDEPVGMAWLLTISEPGDELQVSEVNIDVRSAYRRQGVATSLMETIVPDLTALGQTSVSGYVSNGLLPEAGAALCSRYGLTKRSEQRCSRANIAEIPDGLMQSWIDDAATKAADYRMECFEGPCPDHLAELWAEASAAMEDEPLDDFDYNLYTRSVEVQREADLLKAAHGFRIYRSLAVSADGQAAGVSALYLHEDRPEIGHQGDTGVVADHRGHAIGRWLKAANLQQVQQANPELRVIETYNAQSNPWMLAINEAMAFRPHHIYTGFQGSVADAAAAVAAIRVRS